MNFSLGIEIVLIFELNLQVAKVLFLFLRFDWKLKFDSYTEIRFGS